MLLKLNENNEVTEIIYEPSLYIGDINGTIEYLGTISQYADLPNNAVNPTMIYVDGNIVWQYKTIPPAELRKQAYGTDQLISWEDITITVDQANELWLAYQAESSTKANELQQLIIVAKNNIREQYPDIG